MTTFQLEVVILVTIGGGLTLYWLLGGADFGGGVWDLLAIGPLRERERALISDAIGPVWEANHVWLIFVVTGLLAAFPSAFASLGFALYVPFSIAIGGIVFRGAAFAFRSWGDRGSTWQRTWTRVFGVASIVTPLALGAAAGAVASGRIRVAASTVVAPLWGSWTGPLSIVTGLLALASCAFLAASYLTVEATQRDDHVMEEVFRRRRVTAAVARDAHTSVALRSAVGRGWHRIPMGGHATPLPVRAGRRGGRGRIRRHGMGGRAVAVPHRPRSDGRGGGCSGERPPTARRRLRSRQPAPGSVPVRVVPGLQGERRGERHHLVPLTRRTPVNDVTTVVPSCERRSAHRAGRRSRTRTPEHRRT